MSRSLLDFMNLVRGAHSNNPERNQYHCQKALEEKYGAGRVVTKSSGWQPVAKAAMSELSGSVGGYLLPQDYSDALLETIAELSFIYPRATVIPMFSADLLAPRWNVETAPTAAGIAPFFGGVIFRWGAEPALPETEPTFRMDTFHAWDLLGYCTVSNQWLQDAGAEQPLRAEHYLIRMFGRAAAWQAELAFLQGLGAAQQMPLGIVNSPAT
ncbi:MAG: phage major capsid protein, partial [Acidobacteria bacterium]|nr:phage major capsid protein [Acidobacteriota bacterium]